MQGLSNALKSIANTTYRSEFVRECTCEGCGELVKVFRLIDKDGNKKENSIGCNCNLIRAVHVQQRMVNQKKIDRIFNQYSLVNQGLISASFETFKPYCPELAKAVSQARRYADNFDLKKPSNLFFQSEQFGTGKSHLSMSIIREIKEKGYSAIFISTPRLLTKIRSTFNKRSEISEDELINNLIAADLVVFDDLGTESGNAWAKEKLFETVDQRSGKNNIFTSNLKKDDFLSDVDSGRIFSRMTENTEYIVLNNVPDYRPKKAKMQ
jgi:DNA replication protein DnaC